LQKQHQRTGDALAATTTPDVSRRCNGQSTISPWVRFNTRAWHPSASHNRGGLGLLAGRFDFAAFPCRPDAESPLTLAHPLPLPRLPSSLSVGVERSSKASAR
jgi:hypothetical protein